MSPDAHPGGELATLIELLPEELREFPPRRVVACRHARPEFETWVWSLLLLSLSVVAGAWGSRNGQGFAPVALVLAVPLLFYFVYATFNLIYAVRLALGGTPVAATISDGVIRVRYGTFRVWHVQTQAGRVSIQATGRATPGMVALRRRKQVGLYNPGPISRGIHTRRIA